MHLPKLSDREKPLARIAAFALIAIVVYHGLLKNPCQELLRLSRHVKDIHHELIEMESAMLRQRQVQAEYDRFEKAILATGTDAEELAFILKELEVLARPIRMEIKSIKPLAPQAMGSYKKFLVQMETEGRVTAIIEFLHAVRASPKVLNIEKLRLRALRKGPNMLSSSVLISRISARSRSGASLNAASGGG